ncbi:PREDICTED: T-lymphocyte activation antigen CD80 isoform X1 [Gavialis gangeticus]|uniref:T-lymphocyte activation antigen CD80 isoform X1 n=2 Tax=Gavialis gangeticus TaxID=94835 RepID=UPI00092F5716|nr:PREDICTED: T-lymphocyte activation antigen CD80 isoform X1 [Gavialis gangeticus]
MECESSKRMLRVPKAEGMLARTPSKKWIWLGLFVFHQFSLGFAHKTQVAIAKMGEEVTLPCCYETPSEDTPSNYRVYWQKNVTEVVIAYSFGTWLPNPLNRSSLNQRTFALSITQVEISDAGSYACIVQRAGSVKLCDQTVTLSVIAEFSQPAISLKKPSDCESSEVVVSCSSYGGFPKPKVSGFFNNVSVDWNTSLTSDAKTSLYNVTGMARFNVTENMNLTCSIEYSDRTVSGEYPLTKPDNCESFKEEPSSHDVIIASITVLCIFFVAIILLVRYFRCPACEHVRSSYNGTSQPTATEDETKMSTKTTMFQFCTMTSETSSF